MADLLAYRALARKSSKSEFAASFGAQLFLVKRVATGEAAEPPHDPPMSYRTTSVRVTAEQVDAHVVFGSDLAVWPIQKRAGNPYPERISVGRATNCDIVLRAPYLSKLHAHFWIDSEGELRLTDNDSANGTEVNSQRLLTGDSVVLMSGDKISFGGLDLEVLNASDLYDLLRDDRG